MGAVAKRAEAVSLGSSYASEFQKSVWRKQGFREELFSAFVYNRVAYSLIFPVLSVLLAVLALWLPLRLPWLDPRLPWLALRLPWLAVLCALQMARLVYGKDPQARQKVH